jgi:hypothetical protein
MEKTGAHRLPRAVLAPQGAQCARRSLNEPPPGKMTDGIASKYAGSGRMGYLAVEYLHN